MSNPINKSTNIILQKKLMLLNYHSQNLDNICRGLNTATDNQRFYIGFTSGCKGLPGGTGSGLGKGSYAEALLYVPNNPFAVYKSEDIVKSIRTVFSDIPLNVVFKQVSSESKDTVLHFIDAASLSGITKENEETFHITKRWLGQISAKNLQLILRYICFDEQLYYILMDTKKFGNGDLALKLKQIRINSNYLADSNSYVLYNSILPQNSPPNTTEIYKTNFVRFLVNPQEDAQSNTPEVDRVYSKPYKIDENGEFDFKSY